ncbi:MAG: 4-hydroxybenzoate octaprenyltransferase [Armatimonadetes bacterium]|nr:4-hydroxybenzoate octaprenyltransferase [Armatimonadota bacterium]MBS1712030.1 4-hydroxybenzoate octaprenyltransferase [Armatimonadota bacterium]MBX3109416.1 putative 4-hydroxybenzoate polyprenyltransferase [Fimbriimonadaceae bacterium]
MASEARGWQGFKAFLEMIKVEHSIFALPFAMVGMMWASRTAGLGLFPGWRVFGLIVVAMVSCRSAAMAWNRIADRDIDALNPRTRSRAIPSGILSLRTANIYFYASVVVFLSAAAFLNPLALALAPVALLVTLGYSMTKRFTPLCHFVLGFGLGMAPAAAWVAVQGSLAWEVLPLVGAVMCWTAGFDIIYSLQDEEFDSGQGLHSLPQAVGKARALWVSRFCHIAAVLLLAWSVVLMGGWLVALAGVVFAAGILVYEQSLVKPDDLSRVNLAFFTLNGFVSIGVFLFIWVDWAVRHWL